MDKDLFVNLIKKGIIMDTTSLNKKIELIQWLSTIEDDSILNKISEIRHEENKDWWHSISSEEQKSIDTGISDAENGKLSDHSEARKLYEKWL